MKTPFFGPFDIMRSTNLADNQLINLRPEIVETKDGKNVGALMGVPGLDLLVTVAPAAINGVHPLGTLLYVVSGFDVYTVTAAWSAALVGSIVTFDQQVNMIDSGTQLAIFSNAGAWVAPAGVPLTGATIAATGYPLTGGTIGGGVAFAVGDSITLTNVGGTQTEPAIVVVTAQTGGVPTAIVVLQAGIFPAQPTSFNQFSTSGGGLGFSLSAPTYGTLISGGINYAVGDTIVLEPTNGTQSGAAILTVAAITGPGPLGPVATFTIYQTGAFQFTPPTGFVQKNTTGAGSGLILTSPTYGASTLMQITLPFTPAGNQSISAVYQNGFALCNQPNTMTIWQSEVEDISVWPVLNFATADGESDNVMALAAIHRVVFVLKQRSSEVWTDAGTPGFAFQPINSVLIETGTVTPATVQRLGEHLVWLAQSAEGQGIVRRIDGFTAHRISTHAVETLLATTSTLTSSFAYCYEQEGHQYYVLTVPGASPTTALTLVYDLTASEQAGVPMWHQWLTFNSGRFERHWGNAFAFFNETSVLGDYRNGNLYRINLNTLTDNGTPRQWSRSWRALAQPTMQPTRFSSLQIDMQTGVGIPPATNPLVSLEWSDDGGHTWSTPVAVAAGPPGATAQRVKFNRLGSTRRNSGLDRIFRLSSGEVFPVALIGAELE